MKKIAALFILFSFSFLSVLPSLAAASPDRRRDPFRDLLEERESKEKNLLSGAPQLSIHEIILKGISKVRGTYVAIVNGTQAFPFFIKKGDKFSDGYVYSINDTSITFKMIKENGLPLRNPKEVVKELYQEER